MEDESGESTESMEEVPLIERGTVWTVRVRIEEINAWLTQRSRELITETRCLLH